MAAGNQYFRNVWSSASSLFEGMAVTFSHLLRRPSTVEYPDRMAIRVQDTFIPRFILFLGAVVLVVQFARRVAFQNKRARMQLGFKPVLQGASLITGRR